MPHIYYVEAGDHNFKVWKNGLYMFSKLLFKPVDQTKFDKYSPLGTPVSTTSGNSKYPQLLPDGSAIFSLKAPDAKRVQLDLVKKYDMDKNTDGVWEVQTDSLSEGFHYYLVIIDGVAVADPASDTFTVWGEWQAGLKFRLKEMNITQKKRCPMGIYE